MGAGPAAFYALQDLHAAQGAPTDPTGDMTQYDTQSVGQVPDVSAQYAAAANAWQHAQAPQPQAAPMGAQMAPQPAPPTQPGPMTAPPISPMGPIGPVNTPPPTGDLTANVPDLQSRMQQYLDMAHRVYGNMKQPEYSPEELHERPNMVARILADAGTFGLQEAAWGQRDAARSQYNIKARQHNATMDLQAMNAARQMMMADSTAQMAQARFGLEQQRFSLEALRAQTQENDRHLNDIMKGLQAQRLQQQITMDTPYGGAPSPMAPTAGASGEPAAPYEPAAPGSPLADTAGGASAPSPTPASTPATGATIQPGETPRQFAKRRDAEAKSKIPTSTSRTMAETAPKVLDLVNQVEKDLQNVQPGPLASRYHEFMTGTVGVADPAWTSYRTNVGLLTTLLMRMHVGARGGTQMMDHFKGLLNQGRQSPENMKAALQEIRTYANSVGGDHSAPAPAAPNETAAPAAPETPSPAEPTAPTSIEDILKKHGY